MSDTFSVLDLFEGLTAAQARELKRQSMAALKELRENIVNGENTMNEDKTRLRKLTALRFSNLEASLKKLVDARLAHKAELAKLAERKDNYSPEFFEQQVMKAKADYEARRRAAYAEINSDVQVLRDGLLELHSGLDLGDARLSNALRLIETSGGKLDADVIRKINASFAGDQSALRALRDVYKSKESAFAVDETSRGIYNIDGEFDKVTRAISGDDSITAIAGNLGKIAGFEGVPFNTSPDPDAFTDAARQVLGLTNEVMK